MVKIERPRYLAFEILSRLPRIDKRKLIGNIWRSISQLFGEVGSSKAEIWLVEYNENSKTGIIHTNHYNVKQVRAALAMIIEIEEHPAVVHIIGVSGTLKAAKMKFLPELAK